MNAIAKTVNGETAARVINGETVARVINSAGFGDVIISDGRGLFENSGEHVEESIYLPAYPGIHGEPELIGNIDDELKIHLQENHKGWMTLTGKSGQHGYDGAVFHPSEFIGEGMARLIAETPGEWVTVTVELDPQCDTCADSECPSSSAEPEPLGWALLHRVW